MFKSITNPGGISYIALRPTRQTKSFQAVPSNEPDWEWECYKAKREMKVLRIAFFVMAACAIIAEVNTTIAIRL